MSDLKIYHREPKYVQMDAERLAARAYDGHVEVIGSPDEVAVYRGILKESGYNIRVMKKKTQSGYTEIRLRKIA